MATHCTPRRARLRIDRIAPRLRSSIRDIWREERAARPQYHLEKALVIFTISKTFIHSCSRPLTCGLKMFAAEKKQRGDDSRYTALQVMKRGLLEAITPGMEDLTVESAFKTTKRYRMGL